MNNLHFHLPKPWKGTKDVDHTQENSFIQILLLFTVLNSHPWHSIISLALLAFVNFSQHSHPVPQVHKVRSLITSMNSIE